MALSLIPLLLVGACSGDDSAAELTPSSTQSEIAAESKSIERAAEKAAALIEADANSEITAQEISDEKARNAALSKAKSGK